MKALALMLGTLLVFGVATVAVAQQTTTDPKAAPSAPAAQPKADVDVKAEIKTGPSEQASPGDRRPDVNVNVGKDKPDINVNVGKDKGDDAAALPRSAAGEQTTIFGLSPTAAVVIAAALLVVVILAIVAMTRGGAETTYIDRDRRM